MFCDKYYYNCGILFGNYKHDFQPFQEIQHTSFAIYTILVAHKTTYY